MKVCCDIETNRLRNPDIIWVIVCRDLDNPDNVFRFIEPQKDKSHEFQSFADGVQLWVGHNFIDFDAPVISRLLEYTIPHSRIVDTLVASRLLDYSREGGHSLEQYGEEFGIPKVLHVDYSYFNSAIVDRCTIDTSINLKVYNKLKDYIHSPVWREAMSLEHDMARICHQLHVNGFAFNLEEAKRLLTEIENKLACLDQEIKEAFKPKTKLLKEVHPELTKHGTLHRKDFRWVDGGDLTPFNGGPFSRFTWVPFNPSSPKQVVSVLQRAGWKPTDKTRGHAEFERQLARKRVVDTGNNPEYIRFKEFGWKINETNLSTLPPDAPEPARKLASRILHESRRRTLVEWIGLCDPLTHRIHGQFNHIGSWTHRMSHVAPNTANIPREDKLYGAAMRALWKAGHDRLLIGVDAVGIQLRVLAHYINDKEFTKQLTTGDVHQLNKETLGDVCKDREVAKTFIYAWLLGAGVGKIAEILNCSREEAEEALQKFVNAYTGLKKLKEEQIPQDAKRGYFEGFDGRYVKIFGESESERRHLAMSGYLQNGEAIVMKKANVMWTHILEKKGIPFWQVDLVHDEYQTETENNLNTALYIAGVQAECIRKAGELLNLNCPMAGSFLNKKKQYTIGENWLITH